MKPFDRTTARLLAGLLLAGVATACTDDASGPRRPVAAVLEAITAADQTALPGQAVEAAPSVIVLSESDEPMEGEEVRFEVTRGGGWVERASVVTDADGIASAGRWTLGDAPGPNEVVATAGSLASVTFTATALAPAGYSIDVRYMVPVNSRQAEAVARAVAAWEVAIVADLPPVPISAQAGACFSGAPILSETVDDLLIYIEFVDIDGLGRILGEAGPCFIRSGSGLPVVGHLKLDRADLQAMEANGTIDDVITHEIGHILGIGTLWSMKSLVTGAGGTDPRFVGVEAAGAYADLGGKEPDVPIENSGSIGTRDAHWREAIFGNELMTGYIGATPNPLSALTISSLSDLGYGADPSVAAMYALGTLRGLVAGAQFDLAAHEQVKLPKYEIDRLGRRYRY